MGKANLLNLKEFSNQLESTENMVNQSALLIEEEHLAITSGANQDILGF